MATLQQHLQQPGGPLVCPIALLLRQDTVLVGHRHYATDTQEILSVWTHAGGRSDPGETVEQTLRREVHEEVGIVDMVIDAFLAEVPGATKGDVVPIFICRTSEDASLKEPDKFSEWRWVTAAEYVANEQYSSFNPDARQAIVRYLQENHLH